MEVGSDPIGGWLQGFHAHPMEQDREAAPDGVAGNPGGDPWHSKPSVKRPSRGCRPGGWLLEKTHQHRTGLLLDGEQLAELVLRLL